MPIVAVTTVKRSNADRQREYRQRKGASLRNQDVERKRQARHYYAPEFVGVDSEGIGQGKDHRAVLLGVGGDRAGQYENTTGLHWSEAFNHLYEQYRQRPHSAYVGFYLGYDFNEWLKSLPETAAWRLLTEKGKASRLVPGGDNKKGRRTHYPVRLDGWEFDMLGFKRLTIRPMICDCKDPNRDSYLECNHRQLPNMYICDAGPFFQMPLIKVISRDLWKNDPDGWPISEEEYETVLAGKQRRASAELDDEMRLYNRLENELLARVMNRLAKGFIKAGIRLGNDEWYGPGAAASKWLAMQPVSKRRELIKKVPEWWLDLCKGSYYGGWFEIFAHGMMRSLSYNYDINNAYPYAISLLPCSECGMWSRGKGELPSGSAKYTLVHATVTTLGDRIGAMPYRTHVGSILRPKRVRGWYWLDEIQAADRAGLVETYSVEEWAMYWPNPKCEHGNRPLKAVEDMYYERLRVGKASAHGLAIKLTNNSGYGKFAQNVGSAPYGNWFYASRITSACRIQILDAIATHPGHKESVLMVATDGICFDSPHPGLPLSRNLGEWEETEYKGLCLFKPGVYWHNSGKKAMVKAKTRGVPAKEFIKYIRELEYQFREWWYHPWRRPHACGWSTKDEAWEEVPGPIGTGLRLVTVNRWPEIGIPVPFSMTSCKMALNQNQWSKAGIVNRSTVLKQSSDPWMKRVSAQWNEEKQRLETRIWDLEKMRGDSIDSMPYKGKKILPETPYGLDGDIGMDIGEIIGNLHDDVVRPDVPEMEWKLVYG